MTARPDLSHWHILGAGAIGGLWAMRLHAIGCNVTLIERTSDAATRRLCLTESGQTACHDFPVTRIDNIAESPSPLLVTTKAGDTRAGLAPLLPELRPGDVVLLLQNGMGMDDWLRQQRPDLLVLAAITTDGVFREARDMLVLAGRGETVIGGDTAPEQEMASHITSQWQQAGEQVQAVTDIRWRRWQKLAINCAINPLTARYRCRNGALLDIPEALASMKAICEEVALVMHQEGYPVPADSLFQAACTIARQTSANTSSMLADVLAGRSTEIDYMNGHVTRVARKHGLGVPVNTAITAEIQALHP